MPINDSNYNLFMTDGEKTSKFRFEDFPAEAWHTVTGTDEGGGVLKKLYSSVPWLFRGVDIRAKALAKVPFTITKGETVIDTSEDYKNAVGFWPKPDETLELLEASLTLMGRAYLLKAENQFGFLKLLRYLAPTTISPKIDKDEGLLHFERRIGGTPRRLELEEVAWFWGRDAFTEIGPPDTSPAKTAIRAAGVLFNVDSFVDAFFKRGAIKAMLLAVPKGTAKGERQKLKAWYRKLFEGISKAWATAVVSEKIVATTIGEGIQELSNTTLTKEKRQDITVALGVPANILFSDDANFATAKQEDFRLYDQTLLTEIKIIETNLNLHVFHPQGFSIKFHPQTLQIFQEEEVNRSAALVNLVRSNVPLIPGMKILGYDLPPEMDWEDLAKLILEDMELKASLRIPAGNFATDNPPNTAPSTQRTTQSKALDTYKSHAIKRFRDGKKIKGTKNAPSFDAGQDIPKTLLAAVGGALNRAKSIKDINRIFADAQKSEKMHNITWEDYP
jgi:phage portal protein BeeE